MSELRRHVFVFIGPNGKEGGEDDFARTLILFAQNRDLLGWQLESTMNLPLTTKVKIDTVEGPT
jgi:hypothetical protein